MFRTNHILCSYVLMLHAVHRATTITQIAHAILT